MIRDWSKKVFERDIFLLKIFNSSIIMFVVVLWNLKPLKAIHDNFAYTKCSPPNFISQTGFATWQYKDTTKTLRKCITPLVVICCVLFIKTKNIHISSIQGNNLNAYRHTYLVLYDCIMYTKIHNIGETEAIP